MWIESIIELDKNVGFLTLFHYIRIMNLVWWDSVLNILTGFFCQSLTVPQAHALF